tara:strand:+ start:396 stop:584 length:189 start_codon:yes stop_codon:yes gene_type:complete
MLLQKTKNSITVKIEWAGKETPLTAENLERLLNILSANKNLYKVTKIKQLTMKTKTEFIPNE